MRLYLSAGHNNQTKGAVYAGTTEARQTREVRDEVEDYLNSGWTTGDIVTIFQDDDNFSLQETIENINALDVDLAIDIHFNASTNPRARGVEGYAYSTNAKMGNLTREIVDKISEYTGMKNRGLKYNDKLAFLKKTKCNAILLECGFLSNKDNAKLILDPVQDDLISKAIADTIISYYAPSATSCEPTEYSISELSKIPSAKFIEDDLHTKILEWYNDGHDLMKKL